MKKVVIIGGGIAYQRMFEMYGWEIGEEFVNADLIQFTGGEDVDPVLYGEHHHPRTHSNSRRDIQERRFYRMAKDMGIPTAGICRGGQFLNVMNGGKLYQDVDRHGIGGTHQAIDIRTGDKVEVSSTHHQMMRPAKHGETLCIAHRSTFKEHMVHGEVVRVDGTTENDVEAVLYEDTNTLCFQPHPEFVTRSEDYRACADLYFKYLEEIV